MDDGVFDIANGTEQHTSQAADTAGKATVSSSRKVCRCIVNQIIVMGVYSIGLSRQYFGRIEKYPCDLADI